MTTNRDPNKFGTNTEPPSPSRQYKSFTEEGSPSPQNGQNGQKAQKNTSDTSYHGESLEETDENVKDEVIPPKRPKPIHAQTVGMDNEDTKLQEPLESESDKKIEPEPGISPLSLFEKHILRGDSSIPLSTCCIILSGTNECEKSSMVRYLFRKVIKLADEKSFSDFWKAATIEIEECSTHQQLIILGEHPYKNLTWKFTSQDHTFMMCLLTYFVKVCQKHTKSDNYEQIEFVIAESINAPSEYKEIHNTLAQNWKKLQNDTKLQDCMKAGFTLVNVIDIHDSSRAAKDFLPFLNKYCNRSVHFTCYDKKHDMQELNRELIHNDNQYCNQISKSNQLLKQLKGCMNEEQIVVVTPLSTHKSSQQQETEIDRMTQAITERVGTRNVKSLEMSKVNEDDTEENKAALELVKNEIEKFITDSSFHFLVYLREFKLFEKIRQESNGKFWMGRSEIEALSIELKFKNGTFDRFLRFFTSFGSIFYTHDIPTLDEYVITDIPKFIECAHKLYQEKDPQNEVSKYGLFINTNEEDTRILLKYLTVLGIAVEVEFTQINFPTPTNSQQNKYYYIPSARSAGPFQADEPNEDSIISIVLSFNDCIAENLQALLCSEALRLGGRLEATENHNTTVVRTCKNDASIQIADFGKDVKLTIIRDSDNTSKPIEEKIIETYSHLLSDYPTLTTKTGAKLRYKIQWFSKRMESQKDELIDVLDRKTHKLPTFQSLEIRQLDLIPLATQLAQTYEHNMEKLQLAFKIGTEEMGQYESYQSQMKVLCMIIKFASRSTEEELEAVLKIL